jgi:hypothetical protein
VGFVVDKAALGQVFSEYFGFPCQSSFHQFIHHNNHPGLAQSACSAEWTQVDSTPPPPYQFKKNLLRLYFEVLGHNVNLNNFNDFNMT